MGKAYIDYMEEITEQELYDGLLGHGLFSENLPPVFSSVEFCDWCKRKKIELRDNHPGGYIYYESIRNVNTPRQIGIPNPFAYARLCEGLMTYWDELKKYFAKKTNGDEYKISRIHVRKNIDEDTLFKLSHKNHKNYKNKEHDSNLVAEISIGKKYMVKSDISSCFPSIYTHALAWALVGKEKAKEDRDKRDMWFNKLDRFSRNVKSGETNGLLVGPHASNLLSEIILVGVDAELLKKGYTFIRHIDDYQCFVKSHEAAEQFIVDLVMELKRFNLIVNSKKTKVIKLPIPAETEWVSILSDIFPEKTKDNVSVRVIKKYLDLAIKFMKDNDGDAAPINYAVKVAADLDLKEDARIYIVDRILHLVIIYPYLVRLLSEYVFDRYEVSAEKLKTFISFLYKDSLDRKNYEGISYALFFSVKYGVEISGFDEAFVSECDCITKVMAYLYCKKYNKSDGLKRLKKSATDLSKDSYEENWLFIYEILSSDELKKTDIKRKEEWIRLKNDNISFIHSEYR